MLFIRIQHFSHLLGETAISELNATPSSKPKNTTSTKSGLIIPLSHLKKNKEKDISSSVRQIVTEEEIYTSQNLDRREAKLDKRQAEMDTRQQILDSQEERIDKKIVELKALKHSVEKIVSTHDSAKTARLKSLTKIYETMKTKDAAVLLSKMDPEVVCNVLENMNKVRAAAIMSKMDPQVARKVTKRLAQHQTLINEKYMGINTQVN